MICTFLEYVDWLIGYSLACSYLAGSVGDWNALKLKQRNILFFL